jgi:predicted small lipoprotein YifL
MKISTVALLAAATLSLAACGHKEEEDAGPDASLTSLNVEEDAPLNVVTETPVAPINTVEAAPVAAPIEVAPEAQTQDDADATGDTARVSRGEEDDSAGKPVQ